LAGGEKFEAKGRWDESTVSGENCPGEMRIRDHAEAIAQRIKDKNKIVQSRNKEDTNCKQPKAQGRWVGDAETWRVRKERERGKKGGCR
jgi:hypothetical protein